MIINGSPVTNEERKAESGWNMKKNNSDRELSKEPTLTDAQRIEAYRALSQQLYTQYHDRRTLEWRIHLGLWTLLGLIAYLCVTNDKHFGLVALAVFLAVPIHFIWIIKIVRGEILEQKKSIIFRLKAEQILDCQDTFAGKTSLSLNQEEKSDMPRILSKGFESYWWWLALVLGTTFFLCVGVWFLVK